MPLTPTGGPAMPQPIAFGPDGKAAFAGEYGPWEGMTFLDVFAAFASISMVGRYGVCDEAVKESYDFAALMLVEKARREAPS